MNLQFLSAPIESEILAYRHHRVDICLALGKDLLREFLETEASVLEGTTLERAEPLKQQVASQ
jgi:hypothetical protein